jgi:hypothetical protein
MIYLYNTWSRAFFLPLRFIWNEIFHTNPYHNTYAYENKNWRYVSCGTSYDDDDDDDDTEGIKPMMIKVVLLMQFRITHSGVEVFVAMIVGWRRYCY